MSAIEGLEIIAPDTDARVVPISIIVLTLLFAIQKHGTSMVGKLFAPIMLIWFLLLAVLGARSIFANPEVLQALNPYWAVHFFLEYKTVSFVALGRWCCRLPAWKRCMPIWGISVNCRFARLVFSRAAFAGAELLWSGALLLKHPEAIKTRSFCWRRSGR